MPPGAEKPVARQAALSDFGSVAAKRMALKEDPLALHPAPVRR
jgi:hypothetical protein